MNIHINPQLFNNAKSVKKLKNEEIAQLIDVSVSTVNDITRKQSLNSDKIKPLCQCLDVSPNYLLGKITEREQGIFADVLALKKRAFLAKHPLLNESDYIRIKECAKKRIDKNGIFIPTYDTYLEEVSDSVCMEKFYAWLLSINLSEPENLLDFPTNEELKTILSNPNFEPWKLWKYMTGALYQYLTDEGLYSSPLGDHPTDEEITERFNVVEESRKKSMLEEI